MESTSFLLLSSPSGDSDATIGGHPRVRAGFHWPRCRTCRGPLQYLARLPLSSGFAVAAHGDMAVLLFQCPHDPGMCTEWDAHAGGNAALLVDATEVVATQPPAGPTTLGSATAVTLLDYAEPLDAEEAQDLYSEIYTAPGSLVIGKAAGQPIWIQGDETPTCSCGATMKFAAQLEERASAGLNFGGGGSAYVFVCPACREQARFLWQC